MEKRVLLERNVLWDATALAIASLDISLPYAYRLHRETGEENRGRRGSMRKGGSERYYYHRWHEERHWPNWRRSAERFAFGVAAQLCAATRDFPVHDHLHASQTPKGCSFTGVAAAAAAASRRGLSSHIGWTMGGGGR